MNRITKRLAPGLYRTAEGHTIERVSEEARAQGYGDGWHLNGPDGDYWSTWATKGDALKAIDMV